MTNADALLPTLLDCFGVTELPDFIVGEYLADGRLEDCCRAVRSPS